MVRETRLSPDNFIQPLFVVPGTNVKKPVSSMPGVAQLSVDLAVVEAKKAWDAGVPAIILFGIPDRKDAVGSASWNQNGIVQKASRAIKEKVPGLVVIADVCFCEYTDHGHCGVLHGQEVDNDETLENLGKQSVSLARRRRATSSRPVGMMDGMVGAIREALDESGLRQGADHERTPRSSPVALLRPVPRRRRVDAEPSAIAAATRWIPPTRARPCARRSSTSARAPTSSW
jgi:porphobilinogen synthase